MWGVGHRQIRQYPWPQYHSSSLGHSRSRQMAQSAVQGSASPVIGARGVFGFDLNKPLRGGWLLKQGGSHKAFKKRFFVLYPGFLIYYSSPEKYKYDVARSTLAVGRSARTVCSGRGVRCRRHHSAFFAPPSNNTASTFFPFSEPSLRHQAQGRGDPHGQIPTQGLPLRVHGARP